MARIQPLLPAVILLIALAIGGGGCATVRPPARAAVAEPVPVFVTDYGIHSAIVLPVGRDRYVEYAFGDYGYAALNRDSPFDALGALLFSFGSGFGRTYMPADVGTGLPDLPRAPARMHRYTVARRRVDELLAVLEARYDRGESPSHFNPVTGIHWVRDRQRYSIFNSCNHLTARSLESLGCEVSGFPVFSKFQFRGGDPVNAAVRYAHEKSPPPNVAGPM